MKQVTQLAEKAYHWRANAHYNPRWRHRKPALSSILFQNNARAAGYKYIIVLNFFFLLTLQVATSAYEIKLRDSVWSRTHIKDQVNVRPRMELVLFLEHFFASQVS